MAEAQCDPGGTEIQPISEGFTDAGGVILEFFTEIERPIFLYLLY